jgi:hypothetical protein
VVARKYGLPIFPTRPTQICFLNDSFCTSRTGKNHAKEYRETQERPHKFNQKQAFQIIAFQHSVRPALIGKNGPGSNFRLDKGPLNRCLEYSFRLESVCSRHHNLE